jgi:hypothetical protein
MPVAAVQVSASADELYYSLQVPACSRHHQRQYLYFCTSNIKSSKLSAPAAAAISAVCSLSTALAKSAEAPCSKRSLTAWRWPACADIISAAGLLRQYLYICTTNSSTFALLKQVLPD